MKKQMIMRIPENPIHIFFSVTSYIVLFPLLRIISVLTSYSINCFASFCTIYKWGHTIYIKKREVPWHFENYWTHGETTNDDMFVNSYPLQSWSGNRWSDFRNVGCLEGNRPRTGWAIHSGTMTSQPCAVSQSFCLESLFSMLLSVCNFISWDTGPRKKKN